MREMRLYFGDLFRDPVRNPGPAAWSSESAEGFGAPVDVAPSDVRSLLDKIRKLSPTAFNPQEEDLRRSY